MTLAAQALRAALDPAEVDRLVDEVLSRPAYLEARPGWLAQLRTRVRTWLLERLTDLLGAGAAEAVGWVIMIVLLAVAAILLLHLFLTTRGGAGRARPVAVALEHRRSPSEWLDAAGMARAAGDMSEAVRCAFRAVVAHLDRRGGLDEIPGRTVGEYRAQVAERAPEVVSAFAVAADTFERVWYAGRHPGEEDVEAVLKCVAEVAR